VLTKHDCEPLQHSKMLEIHNSPTFETMLVTMGGRRLDLRCYHYLKWNLFGKKQWQRNNFVSWSESWNVVVCELMFEEIDRLYIDFITAIFCNSKVKFICTKKARRASGAEDVWQRLSAISHLRTV
jgi:hypothetical protein